MKIHTLVFMLIYLYPFLSLAQSTTSTLTGVVRDESGNVLPGTRIFAKHTETGLERSEITTESGTYRFLSLPVGVYEITAQVEGFATQVQKSVSVGVGRSVNIDFALRFAVNTESVEVEARPPLIEKKESHLATYVNPDQIANLPLNDRQFANLAILAPGTSLMSNPDPSRFRSLTVGLMGASGRNMNITIDSGDNNDDTIGGINQFYSLESISEFNFLTSRYKAEYSRASGGVLNVVTKSGANDIHGSALIFFRDDALNALSKDEKNMGITEPSAMSREQFGGSFGGPIQKNKLHFFLAFEREQLDSPVVFDSLGTWPEFDGSYNLPFRHSLSTGKISADIDPKNYLVVRYGYQKSRTLYYVVPPLYAPTTWSSIGNTLHSILVTHNYLFSNEQLNELLFQYSDFKNQMLPLSNDPFEIFLDGTVFYVGQHPNSTAGNIQKKYQFKDDYSWTSTIFRGTHQLKTGINFIHEPTVEGVINFEDKPYVYTYAGADRASPIVEIKHSQGLFEYNFPNNQYGIYFQDDWYVSDRLTLNLGVRYDYVTGFDLDQSQNPLYQELVASPFNYSWLGPVKANPSGKVSNDPNNIAPRLGFAYDWKGDGTTVIRSGWGMYYDFPFTNGNLLWPDVALSSWGFDYSYINDDGILNSDGTLFRIGDPLPPNQLQGFAQQPPFDVASPDFVVPYTRQFSAGFSHLIGANTAIDVDYVRAVGKDRFVRFQYTLDTQPAEFGNPRFHYNGAFHNYNALNVTIRTQPDKSFQLHAAYTLSKVTGNTLWAADEFRLGGVFFPCESCTLDFRIGPKDDPRMEGPLDIDQRHRIVVAAIADVPWKFRLSGIFRANSAPPYNAFILADNDGDGFPYSIVDEHVNSRRGSGFSQLDLRINKIFSLHKDFQLDAIFEVFNLFNADNPGRYIGDLGDENFGQPSGYGEPRAVQLGARITF